jgi:hypothetical protein
LENDKNSQGVAYHRRNTGDFNDMALGPINIMKDKIKWGNEDIAVFINLADNQGLRISAQELKQ